MVKSKRSVEGGRRGPVPASEAPAEQRGEAASFETALEQLEATVSRLEEGEMPLEEALELFETGVKLSRQCSSTLEIAERRIEILVADRANGDPEVAAFASDEPSDENWNAVHAATGSERGSNDEEVEE